MVAIALYSTNYKTADSFGWAYVLQTYKWHLPCHKLSELRSCVKVEVAVLGSRPC